MDTTSRQPKERPATWPGLCLLTLLALILGVVPAAQGAPPAGRTYFTILLGLEEPYSWQAGCLRFSRSEICTGEGDCGTWIPTESGPNGAVSFDIEIESEGPPVVVEGQIRIESRGKKDAIGGAAHAEYRGQLFNFALNGRSSSPGKCRRLLRKWERSSP